MTRGLRAAVLLLTAWVAMAGEDPRWTAQRAQLRQERAAFQLMWQQDTAKRAAAAATAVGQLIETAGAQPSADQLAQLKRLVAGVRGLSPEAAEPLAKRLPKTSGAALAAAQPAWEAERERFRVAHVVPLQQLADRALEQNRLEVAHATMVQVLAFDPDHAALHRNLGMEQVDGHWYGPRDLPTVRGGFRWEAKLGWIVGAQRARYDAGEYFDLAAQRWTTLAEANARHARVDDPWRIQTEHLDLRGTAPLADLVAAADRLERFYDRIFAAYAVFFAPRGKRAEMKLLFGLADHPRLKVTIAADEKDYRALLPRGVSAPEWSAGVYVSQHHGSWFLNGSDQIIYHEFTHQILHEFTGGCQAPAWLVEGIAVYSQAPHFDGERLVLGEAKRNWHLASYIQQRRAGKQLPLAELMQLGHATWSAAKDPSRQYSAAGALAQYAMEADNRQWRADFLDFLRDSYRAEAQGRSLAAYCGQSEAAFVAAFDAWAAAFAKPLARPAPPRPR